MKKYCLYTVLIGAALMQQACQPKEPVTIPQFDNGIFVINEGTFPNGEGALSFYDRNTNKVTIDLYKVKTGVSLGLLPQSVNVIDEQITMCVTNSNVLLRASTGNFSQSPKINLLSPRYTVNTSTQKLYVSCWGNAANNTPAGVSIVDKFSQQAIGYIETDPGAEEMVKLGDRVFVTCNGGFGNNNTINIIDINTETVVNKLVVGPNPDGMVKDAENNIWILCSGQYDASFNLVAPGKLVRYNTANNTLDKSFIFPATAQPANLKINPAGDMLYCNFAGKIHTINPKAASPAPTAFANGYFYGLAVDANGDVFASDPKDYVSAGYVKRFSNDGVLRDSFQVATVPSEILIYKK
jgi:hypothetical protein